ncbi:UTP--glucose-1-phosphate uridylyltransferase [Angomonas deanei]|nr:UTP--glucose-1-phosphate uridylyltransferase [Angomonas deanei]|eukprot:EPY39795.1 UTP--glucose-1-phosphate uridylyltransferase [Angomonas deanei]
MKLNGGLGTGMGLSDAKTLLKVKDEHTFLDLTARQILFLREKYGDDKKDEKQLKFMLMNSFSTEESTKKFFQNNYPIFCQNDDFEEEIQLLQNQVPKILQNDLDENNKKLFPVSWPKDASMEWAPPGHGDLYIALYGSGKLKKLLDEGYQYMFVSNGDNLGATLESSILQYMHEKKIGFLMEVCERTENDRKGGHLAQWKNNNNNTKSGLLLRESAQCAPEDEAAFQDIQKYRYFNTNNLWIHLPTLFSILQEREGVLPLPVIRNAKTVDPTDTTSPKVFQLETAMGAAIELFSQPPPENNNHNNSDNIFRKSAALVVPRVRFAPVKTCSDLLLLMSDCYTLTDDFRLVATDTGRKNPILSLDNKYYKLLNDFTILMEDGVPSLKECGSLTIKGKVKFEENVILKGNITIENTNAEETYVVKAGTVLENQEIKI